MSQATEDIAKQFANAAVNKKNWGAVAYNVLSEGLSGDGLSDDTAKLQALINKAIDADRRTILFPHGQYFVTALTNADQVDFVGDNSSFVGGYTGTIGDLGGFAALEVEFNELKAETVTGIFNVVTGYAADPTGAASSTSAIQAAINACSASGGGIVYIPSGTFLISSGGANVGRNYGLMMKQNVTLKGAGSTVTTLKAANNSNMDVIISDRTTPTPDIGLFGFKVDGNYANQTVSSSFNIWIKDCNHLLVDDLYSYNATNWGVRLENVTNVLGGILRVEHAADLNADGLHIKDSSYIVIDKIIIDSKGDDGFIIEASNSDSHDISIGEIIVTTPVTTTAAGRGVFLFVDDSVTVTQRNIYNISMPNVLTHNCKQAAFGLTAGNFYNIDISLSDYGSQKAVNLVVGSPVLGAGFIKNSNFNIKSWNPDQNAIEMTIVNGVIERNSLDVKIYNPGDSNVGMTLSGDYWKANIALDYNPLGTKTNPSIGLHVFARKSEIHASIKGAQRNIFLRDGAIGNTIYIGYLESASLYDIDFQAAANNNRIIGGEITGVITNLGTGNQFIGVKGGDNYGNASISPNASGNGTIAHGLKLTPGYVNVDIRGDNAFGVDVQSVDATNITVRIKNTTTNADVTTGTYVIDWKAQI